MPNTKDKPVSVLLTGDVDFSTHHPPDQKVRSFGQMVTAGRELRGGMTFFFVAREAQQVSSCPPMLHAAGHEIGCHGLTHGNEEEYDRMALPMQEQYLHEATTTLRAVAGCEIRSFRGPRVKVSGPTLKILSGLGYVADSTICSQRFDVVSSNGLDTGWLRAPRKPYHPSETDAYRRGDLPILEVPVSALLVPFISSTLYVLGLSFMELLFRILYLESRRTGKPIVYLFHPYEFADEIKGAKVYGRDLKVHGLRMRRHLYRGDAATRLDWNRRLWRYMAGFEGVRFVTASQYVDMQRR
jgi:hypothetical protein